MSSSQEIIITLLGGTFLLLFLAGVVIVAAIRYQTRKKMHAIDILRLKSEGEQEILRTKLEVQDETLTEVSHEIHDNIGQILSVVKLNLHALKVTEERAQNQVAATIELVNRAISDLRNLSKILNSDYIANQPLSYLLQREIDVIGKAEVFQLELICRGEEPEVSPERKLILFRITQECLQNAIKHSKAPRIVIEITFTEAQCILSIADNGVGFNYEMVKSGNGFTNLRTRSSLVQATFDVQSEVQSGTRVSITMPLL